jgi:Lar family restriction alleviation protein
MSAYLKPCPYCGAETWIGPATSGTAARCLCFGCGALGPPARTTESAILLWNTRPATKEVPPDGREG